jgi:hypothetical protein
MRMMVLECRKGREGEGREGMGREGKGREGKGRDVEDITSLSVFSFRLCVILEFFFFFWKMESNMLTMQNILLY